MFQIIISRKQNPTSFKAKCFLSRLIFGLFFLIVLNACALNDQLTQTDINTRVISIKTTTEPEEHALKGYLFIHDSIGIQQIQLTDNTSEYLLTANADWTDWKASFSQNKKYLAYSIKNGNGAELWYTSLLQWQPERLLVVNDVDFDIATPLWSVNDRYLLFVLSVLEEGEVTDETIDFRTYVIDTKTMEMVHQPFWSGDCFTLAPSPQTNQLAIWCDQVLEIENTGQFLVLELNEDPWMTQQAPQPLTKKCFPRRCVWTSDGEFVAYIEDDYPQLLFSVSMHDPTPIQLDDKHTDYAYGFPLWSPDGLFLYYTGACVNNFQRPSVMSVADQEIIWCIPYTSNRGKFGNVSVVPVSWSPDNRYLAVPITPNLENEILILDITAQKEHSRISNLSDIVLDMVWADDFD
jgi:Tol biopolymer transport system component